MFRLAVVPAVVALALTFGAADAFAHVTLVSTNPGKDAKLTRAPASVSMTFSEGLRSGSLTVSGPDGQASSGVGTRNPRNIKQLLVKLRHGLGGGRYTVHAKLVAPDGDHQTFTYSFTVR